jgi:urease accessory protein
MALTANLHIETALGNERTILKKSFCTAPFKIADITEDKRQDKLSIMLMSSSPGILDDDEFYLEIDVAKRCNLELQTQSYQRLFQMKQGARQFLNVYMKEDSSFVYIAHPLVPHENSIFFTANKILMDESSSLTWGEVISCGRSHNGEIFKFSSYQSITEVFYKDKLVVKENILMKPTETDLRGIGQLEGYTHQASLIFIDKAKNINNKTEAVLRQLQQQENIEFGMSSLPVNGMIIRVLGYKAEQLFDLLKSISCVLSKTKTIEGNYVS